MKSNIAIKIYRILRTVQSNGLFVGIKFAAAEFFARDISIRFSGIKHPVLIRAKTSDACVAFATFVRQEYKTPRKDFFEVIIDLGANVGYSAIYFAHHYPNAKIICLEPSEENVICLKKNTRFYDNIVLVDKGVWWRQANLTVENPDGASWVFRFKEVEDGGVPSVAIDDLLREHSCNRKIMVKMDIEGAEKEIFKHCNEWISETSCIQVEIHNCWKEVFDQFANFDYKGYISGENIVIELDD